MSYIDSENCSEHLMTIGMGLDRAPFEFQKLVFLVPPTATHLSLYYMTVIACSTAEICHKLQCSNVSHFDEMDSRWDFI